MKDNESTSLNDEAQAPGTASVSELAANVAPASASQKSGAAFVALGIFLSRVSGFVRETLFAYAFGNSLAADAFKGALRIPNLLQNLLGEGVLSASFIPVYAKLRASNKNAEADLVASAVLTILALICGIMAALGIAFAPFLVDFITPGFDGQRRALAIELVRIFFPATAVLVLSAWCLGVLNSHRRFFLPYVAPVFWNGAIVVTLLCYRSKLNDPDLARAAAWGVVIGSLLQFGVQLPSVFRLLGKVSLTFGNGIAEVRTVLRNFFPVALGRGVVQISAFIDSMIASFLAIGSVSAISYAQMIYLLPVSLFGMSVSAAELPQMSIASASTDLDHRDRTLRSRGRAALRQILFFVVPSTVAFLFLGQPIISALYEYGKFTAIDTQFVSSILFALAIGLIPATSSRLFASTFYAIGDPKTPFRSAVMRVILSSACGATLALWLFPKFEMPYTAAGLAFGSSIGSWFEWAFLRNRLHKALGSFGLERYYLPQLVLAGTLSGFVALGVAMLTPNLRGILSALFVCGVFGVTYLAICILLKVPECKKIIGRLVRF